MLELQISAIGLFALNALKQRFEVSFTEALGTFALNDFEEQGRSVFHRFGEDLQQVTTFVAIDQYVEFLQGIQILVNLPYAIQHIVVIGFWHIQRNLHRACEVRLRCG